jgi:hypothetical protein
MRVRRITKSDYYLRHVCPSACISSAPTGWISVKFYILNIFRKSVQKIQVLLKSDKIKRSRYVKTYVLVPCIYNNISLDSCLKETFQTKVVQKVKTRILYSTTIFFPKIVSIIIIIIILTAIGLTPGGSSTVHIYTQTAHRIHRTEHT